jgi:hypothetical protein
MGDVATNRYEDWRHTAALYRAVRRQRAGAMHSKIRATVWAIASRFRGKSVFAGSRQQTRLDVGRIEAIGCMA